MYTTFFWRGPSRIAQINYMIQTLFFRIVSFLFFLT